MNSGEFRVTVPVAGAGDIAAVRKALAGWLGRTPVTAERAGDIALACYEAMANVVEHAYFGSPPGPFDISVLHHRPAHRITATITDQGQWRRTHPSTAKGRGMALLAALSDRIRIRTDLTGTTVYLGWNDINPRAGTTS